MSRAATAAVRSMISAERDAQAEQRDNRARERDLIAEERDQVADLADHEAVALAREIREADTPTKLALEAAASARSLAASARSKAAADRERAARDRQAAARDREFLRGESEMERSQMDELTGAYRRGMGEILLRHELTRAKRLGAPLTLAFVDADRLKETNTRSGHAAGDALLRQVYDGLQARLRPYDPIVRWGGDEFVCTASGVIPAEARIRIEQAEVDLGALDPPVSITFGVAAMQPADTLAALVGRADAVQREAKGKKRG
ncbi:MAG: GGDEF domain-containing protein [Solirubrobacterales bacterium]